MANRKTTMTDLKMVIRELQRGTPLRELERKMHLSRTSLRTYRDRAENSGYSYDELRLMDESALNDILCRKDAHRNRDEERYSKLKESLQEYAQIMKRRHMTYDVLYEEVYCKSTEAPYGYTQFKAILQEYEKNHDYKYHNVYDPADMMQVDFAGDPLWVVDRETGERMEAHVLVCVLPYSMMSYATAMLSTKMEYFFNGLNKALTYFGGVPAKVKSDNMRQWVKKYDRYEPDLNDSVIQWGLHNGTEILTSRAHKPRDKGPAEGLVDQVYKYYYSRIAIGGPGNTPETFFSVDELNMRLEELNDMYCDETMKGRGYSRKMMYRDEEMPYMMPLPVEPYSFKYVREFVVKSNYHVQIDGRKFYSIPYKYVGEKAKAVYDAETIEIWIGFSCVWTHKRKYVDGYYTIQEHMPPSHQAYTESKEYNAAYYIKKGRSIGSETVAVIDAVLKSKPFVQQAYSACAGILRLASRYTPERLEKACSLMNPKQSANYKRLKNILEHNLDQVELPQNQDENYIPFNENVRGATAYQ